MEKTEVEKEVEEFFKRRFPDKDIEFEKKCGYFYEWVKRFDSGHPERWMDTESSRIFAGMLRDRANRVESREEEGEVNKIVVRNCDNCGREYEYTIDCINGLCPKCRNKPMELTSNEEDFMIESGMERIRGEKDKDFDEAR